MGTQQQCVRTQGGLPEECDVCPGSQRRQRTRTDKIRVDGYPTLDFRALCQEGACSQQSDERITAHDGHLGARCPADRACEGSGEIGQMKQSVNASAKRPSAPEEGHDMTGGLGRRIPEAV